jgi:hypothetical protein
MVVVLSLPSGALAASPTRDQLAIRYSGPVTISAWRASEDARQQDSAATQQWNHYCFSTPPPFYYCGYGFGCGYGWYGYSYANGWYGFVRPHFYHYPAGAYLP